MLMLWAPCWRGKASQSPSRKLSLVAPTPSSRRSSLAKPWPPQQRPQPQQLLRVAEVAMEEVGSHLPSALALQVAAAVPNTRATPA